MGMKTCFARYGYQGQGKRVMADYKIERIEDVLKITNIGKNIYT